MIKNSKNTLKGGHMIKKKRNQKNLTQEQMANKLGISLREYVKNLTGNIA